MKLTVDEQSDALYLRLDDSKIIESQEAAPGIVLDYDGQNQVVGIEVLRLSSRSPRLNLRELVFQLPGPLAHRQGPPGPVENDPTPGPGSRARCVGPDGPLLLGGGENPALTDRATL